MLSKVRKHFFKVPQPPVVIPGPAEADKRRVVLSIKEIRTKSSEDLRLHLDNLDRSCDVIQTQLHRHEALAKRGEPERPGDWHYKATTALRHMGREADQVRAELAHRDKVIAAQSDFYRAFFEKAKLLLPADTVTDIAAQARLRD